MGVGPMGDELHVSVVPQSEVAGFNDTIRSLGGIFVLERYPRSKHFAAVAVGVALAVVMVMSVMVYR